MSAVEVQPNQSRTAPLDVPLVVVSHRGPISYSRQDGERVASRGSGGLVTAFAGLGPRIDQAVWICAAIGEEDAAVAREHGGKAFVSEDTNGWRVRLVELDSESHRKFYGMIANPLLWFLQHRLWDLSDAPDIGPSEHDAWHNGYVTANRRLAAAVVDELGDAADGANVLIQDYHLYLVPGLIRRVRPDVTLRFFCHIPWPQSHAWRVLPDEWRRAIFEGLLGADIVGFQTEENAHNFVVGCAELLDLDVDLDHLQVHYDGRTIACRWYPVSVDADQFEELAASPHVHEHEQTLIANRREYLVVRVDRTDLSKNILRGFRAFDLLLDEHPELRERITFLALLQPSRQDVNEYVVYLEKIKRTVADLNLKHGKADWQPIDLHFVDDLDLAVAAYKQYDALMVNAIADGMNLVAKEGPLVNRRDGVLLLSETTGAHAELGRFAVSVHPFDVTQQADALWQALTMPREQRRARREACAEIVRRNSLQRWMAVQLEDRR